MTVESAWKGWWNALGHVARCNRDMARTREAFEAGYLAALRDAREPKNRSGKSQEHELLAPREFGNH